MKPPTTVSTPEPRLTWEPTVNRHITRTTFNVKKKLRRIHIEESTEGFTAYFINCQDNYPIGTRATLEQAKQMAGEYYKFLTR